MMKHLTQYYRSTVEIVWSCNEHICGSFQKNGNAEKPEADESSKADSETVGETAATDES